MAGLAGPCSALEGREILRRAEKVRNPELDYAVDFRLVVLDPSAVWKERTALYTMIARGKDHSLVVMREPEQFHPGTLLIAEGLYWLLLPRSERPFQLSPRHVLNGDISNGDLARGNLLTHYEVRLDGEEQVRGEDCYRLELARTRNLGLYRRIRAWITREGFRPKQFEYYGETGEPLKLAQYEDYRQSAIGLRPMRIEVANRVRPTERSVLTFDNLRKIDASGIAFTREALASVRDAFEARRGPDGAQARLEDVLPLLGAARP